jgi:hypothetical protein
MKSPFPPPEINDTSAYDEMPRIGCIRRASTTGRRVALAGRWSLPRCVRSGRHPDRFPHRGGPAAGIKAAECHFSPTQWVHHPSLTPGSGNFSRVKSRSSQTEHRFCIIEPQLDHLKAGVRA